jgi:hypothetical protein
LAIKKKFEAAAGFRASSAPRPVDFLGRGFVPLAIPPQDGKMNRGIENE